MCYTATWLFCNVETLKGDFFVNIPSSLQENIIENIGKVDEIMLKNK